MSKTTKKFDRLQNALNAAGNLNQKQYSDSYLNNMMQDVVKTYDIRATVSFDG